MAALSCFVLPSVEGSPIKVFVLVGQSNMQGHAHERTLGALLEDPLTAPILGKVRDAQGAAIRLDRVWVSSLSSGGLLKGSLRIGFGASDEKIGPELGFGVRMSEVLLYWGGDERGSDFSGPPHDFAWCVPIATQCLHAAGSALAFKLRGEPRVAVTVVGDGGSSKGDALEAMNAASAFDLPLVLVIVNNQWAISVPRSKQNHAKTLAQKGIAAGLPAVQVDGNDLIASRWVMEQALERARAGKGATIIEMMTYRLSDHTTADDATRYRDREEVEEAWKREPVARLRRYLIDQGAWSREQDDALVKEAAELVESEVAEYLAVGKPGIESMFDYMYAELPHDLSEQRERALEELK